MKRQDAVRQPATSPARLTSRSPPTYGRLWTSAPFPALRDELFRAGYASTAGERAEQMSRREFVTHDWVEPTFDAADIIRCGQDVFVRRRWPSNSQKIRGVMTIPFDDSL